MWKVTIKKSVFKQLRSLPDNVLSRLRLLADELENDGPVRGNWPNYSKLPNQHHHCHLKKGKPTYVAVWREHKQCIEIEVVYVGSHENAPYE